MEERKLDRKDESYIDLSRLISEFRSVLSRMYWVILALMLLMGGVWLARSYFSYTPMYESSVTFTIKVDSTSTSDISTTSSYYDKTTAEQLGKTFPYLVQSDYFRAKLQQKMNTSSINGTISASTVTDTNLFILKVTSSSSKDAFEILQSVIEVYPDAADYVVGNTSMELLTQPSEAKEPYNSFSPLKSTVKGALIGFAVGMVLLLIGAATRRTVRTMDDIRHKLNLECLAALPAVTFKRRKSNANEILSIQNPNIPASFLENTRSLRIKLIKQLTDNNYKTVLVTSTMPGEGKTTVAANLAQSLSRGGARVILVDADLRKPSVKRALGISEPSKGLDEAMLLDNADDVVNMLAPTELESLFVLAGDKASAEIRQDNALALRRVLDVLSRNADYIIVDTPPCGLLADSVNLARAVDCILYVLGAGAVQVPQVLDGVQFLDVVGTPLVGCVLNGVNASSRGGYGYGGYGYGSYGYGSYGYGQDGKYSKRK